MKIILLLSFLLAALLIAIIKLTALDNSEEHDRWRYGEASLNEIGKQD